MLLSAPVSRKVRVGLIGCGEIAQVVHIPTLNFLSDLFQITYLCDVSRTSLEHCKSKVIGQKEPATTTNPEELCASPEVEVVFVINSDEYHALHGILALKYNKHVFIEKPMSLNDRDADAIIAAEKASEGCVMVGYMRRYAPAFQDAIREIGGMEKILYARVRDIIGPNSTFVDQSGTFPKKASDFAAADVEDRTARATKIVAQGMQVEAGVNSSDVPPRIWRALGGLGSHDLSLMREALGMPSGVVGAYLKPPFWSAIFEYPTFSVTYESGLDSVPRFDAHIEVYSATKTVRVQYDSPYIKGLPITMHVQEDINGGLRECVIRKTYEDPYTIEMKELYQMVVDGKAIKTTAEDAKKDLEIFRMLVRSAAKNAK
ncbi:hypothetical protein PENARI_c003G10091 [Penicillium arizonense]|uniref:Gfo/Idh/MocA-like oxidoreductase N-terminal domain-containing protein n=1 Tax=Penicillium arizonense TaxID=1835702 RepID=A0A1F5LTI3_PENAI|nr:hypothetical protein PENARI_c003G10091 [Penicillium arizonense]OGE56475.1 hypothetical protein PENARI_c003G10091 [Penicillium arizonense]